MEMGVGVVKKIESGKSHDYYTLKSINALFLCNVQKHREILSWPIPLFHPPVVIDPNVTDPTPFETVYDLKWFFDTVLMSI